MGSVKLNFFLFHSNLWTYLWTYEHILKEIVFFLQNAVFLITISLISTIISGDKSGPSKSNPITSIQSIIAAEPSQKQSQQLHAVLKRSFTPIYYQSGGNGWNTNGWSDFGASDPIYQQWNG